MSSPQGAVAGDAATGPFAGAGADDYADYAADDDTPRRDGFTARDMVHELWAGLGLPGGALGALRLPGAHEAPAVPSSYKIGVLAQGAVALSALAAAEIHRLRNGYAPEAPPLRVDVPLAHALAEFRAERLYTLDGRRALSGGPGPVSTVGGLHRTSDGHVRVHDGFPHHARGVLSLAGLPPDAPRAALAARLARWASIDLENVATDEGRLAVYALRSYAQWDCLPQARALGRFPVDVHPLAWPSEAAAAGAGAADTLPPGLPPWMPVGNTKGCLEGLRVVELSRVIAAPVCGKTLAAHGADVVWVTAPHLPNQPELDREFARGKRTVQLDLGAAPDRARLLALLHGADVLVQGYRPGALAAAPYGLDAAALARANPALIVANLSAFGPRGPWAARRGFDSLVQTCAGLNVSEAAHAADGSHARPLPCQALDHAAGFLLAAGVIAAVHHRATAPRPGPWRVDVSLAGVMKYLRSLGQYPGATGFTAASIDYEDDAAYAANPVHADRFEVCDTAFGVQRALKHSAVIEGVPVGWALPPKPLGSDTPEWL